MFNITYFFLLSLFLLYINQINCVNNPLDIENNIINDKNIQKTKDISSKVRNQIRKFRGGNDEFYEKLLLSLTVTTCDLKIRQTIDGLPANVRFVDKDSQFALKDSDGNCVLLNDPEEEVQLQYSKGYCEVKENCYWAPFNASDNYRMAKYDIGASFANEIPQGAITLQEANKFLEEWVKGLAQFIIPGVALSILSFLTMVFFLFCRCCCNKCGGRNGRPQGYSCQQKLIPLIFHFVFNAGILACIGVSFIYNHEIMDSISTTFDITFDLITDSKNWVSDVREPLIDINSHLSFTVKDVSDKLQNSTFIEDGLDNINNQIKQFGKDNENVVIPENCSLENDDTCFECKYCTNISDEVKASTDGIDNSARDGVEELKNSREYIFNELLSVEDSISKSISSTLNDTDIMQMNLDESIDTVGEIRTNFDNQQQLRKVGFTVIFAFFVIVIALSVVGILFGLTPCKFLANILHIAYIFGFITLIIGFLVSSVMIGFSVLLGDACELSMIMANDWKPYMGEEAALGLNACFRNQSLLEAYDLTDQLDFKDLISFPKLQIDLNFKDFDNLKSNVLTTNSSTFAMDDTINDSIESLNEVTGVNLVGCSSSDNNYNKDNIKTPWEANGSPVEANATLYMENRYDPTGPRVGILSSCDTVIPTFGISGYTSYQKLVLDLYLKNIELLDIEENSKVFIENMQTDIENLDYDIKTFKDNIINLQDSFVVIEDELKENLYKSITQFENSMYCEFIATGYHELMEEMCGTLMPSILVISLLLFLSSVFLIGLTIMNIKLSKRLTTKGNGIHIASETEFK